jgi:acyl dehydratase
VTVLYYEDLPIGQPSTFGSYRLERAEIISFAAKWDPQPFHVDDEAGARSIFGGLTACAAHLFAVSSWLNSQNPDPPALLAGLGGDGMRLASPGRPGDLLHMELTYRAKRRSQSKPDRAVVDVFNRVLTDDGRLVLEQGGAILVACREDLDERSEWPERPRAES